MLPCFYYADAFRNIALALFKIMIPNVYICVHVTSRSPDIYPFFPIYGNVFSICPWCATARHGYKTKIQLTTLYEVESQ